MRFSNQAKLLSDREKSLLLDKIARKYQLSFGYKPFSELVKEKTETIASLAKSLEKSTPDIRFSSPREMYLANEQEFMMGSILVHILNNSITHGLESGKGTITILVESHPDVTQIKIGDDGKGLNLPKLKQKYFIRHPGELLTDDKAIANTVFLSGISTSEQITDIAGRGVGMDAVKDMLEKVGGTIDLEFLGEKNASGFRLFQFVIGFPPSIPWIIVE